MPDLETRPESAPATAFGKLKRAAPKLLAILIFVAAVGGVLSFLRQREQEPLSDDASIDADVVHIAPSVLGRISHLPIEDNQLVKAGDVLFEIDPEPFRLHVEVAASELKAAEALLDSQRRAMAVETSNAVIADEQVVQARTSLQLAANTLGRLEPLLGRGYVSAQAVDDARTAKRKSEIAHRQALEQATAARSAIGSLDAAMATVAAKRAALALAERDLSNSVVRAPHDGRVTGLNVKTGEYVLLAQSLFTLIVTEEWFAVANFRETDLARIADGACAVAYSLIDRSVAIPGRVDSIGWGVADQDRFNLPRGLPYVAKSVNWVRVEQRFPVRVRLLNPPADLMRLGASAVVRIRPKERC
jgi:multidrug efflux system membrane fusion protein